MSKITLDREREIRYDFNAIAELEDVSGCGVQDLMKKKQTLGATRRMLWAGLLGDDPDLTLQGAGSLITSKNLKMVSAACTEALKDFFETSS